MSDDELYSLFLRLQEIKGKKNDKLIEYVKSSGIRHSVNKTSGAVMFDLRTTKPGQIEQIRRICDEYDEERKDKTERFQTGDIREDIYRRFAEVTRGSKIPKKRISRKMKDEI